MNLKNKKNSIGNLMYRIVSGVSAACFTNAPAITLLCCKCKANTRSNNDQGPKN